ncbi:DNA topoisomerase 1 [Candidatus Hartigia pinicola]|nr:DNA topoisomerase 1 [Candidatus Hartigia pinicola]
MGKALVIVESPAKAKTINKYLGSDYIVKSSIGHIRDLPKSGSGSQKKTILSTDKTKKIKKDPLTALVKRMGIDPYHDWKVNYQVLPGKEKIVSELKTLATYADHVYLATDLDREGEAIAWHLREVIGGDDSRFSRVVFNEITQNAITQAFENPSELNIDRVNAQQARRFMDRVVGYLISPLLWKKLARGLSAGRVQSVAVRLIVEREREIKTFLPEEYWEVYAELVDATLTTLRMEITHYRDKSLKLATKEETDVVINLLKKAYFRVIDREDKVISSKPSAPFITSTLQQAASSRLRFSVKKTMMMSQRLYEAGYITYMRTDSTNLSQDALNMLRTYINNTFGEKYLPKNVNIYSDKNHAQEAHEAIRPSNINVLADSLKDIESDAKRLYQLIWNQCISSQMTAAQYDSTTLVVKAGDFKLKAKGYTLRFDGWTHIIPSLNKNDKNKLLPPIQVGSELCLVHCVPYQHFTKSPPRFNEASLVKELEKRGIGRPSTYSAIISTIQDRGYVQIKNRRFYAEKIGEIVTDRLKEHFQDLMNYDFTARMENQLDHIANHKAEWKVVLDDFFSDFTQKLNIAEKKPEDGGMRHNPMVITSIICPNCKNNMGIRTASTGVFLGCASYTLSLKERCKKTINLIPENELLNIIEGDYAETNALRAKPRCTKCSIAMDSYFLDNQRKLHICGNNPTCEGYVIEKGTFFIKIHNTPVIYCNKCNSEMNLKIGRFGKYMSCTNAECKNTRKISKSGEIFPPKEDPVPLPELAYEKSNSYFVLRDGATGLFLAANTFPKSKETRAPLVEELQRFKDRLPEKLLYLADAPAKDPEGNSTFVRFSRKTKQRYISSKKNGKLTSWSAFYINGEWKSKKK